MIWWRYIDNVFTIWPHGEETLMGFLKEINSFHPTIKSTAEWSREAVTFLDTRVTIKEGRLVTDLHTIRTQIPINISTMIVATHITVRKASPLVKPSGYEGSALDPVTIYVALRN